ncbi:hypothetical protein BSR29_03835 [Boudabousia liubingyangii]|uniref:SseB protein N-terminal domain-containing protein n=1 Tax=Boudabousia liubingyangii TaxID=1921764 RepID=A0A1Q5PNF2_9ACTO|nr:SseB family protein [Boudabousia liubingyangii]OKL48980.1 hypothetical protein BSR29_03835 [Boudabousia liubingyangii]
MTENRPLKLTEAQRQKLAQRLGQKPVGAAAHDAGDCPAAVAAALSETKVRARLEKVAHALVGQRLLMPVYAHPEEHSEPKNLAESLIRQEVNGQSVLLAFTDVANMRKFDSTARPVPVPVKQFATWALSDQQALMLNQDPELILGMPALSALVVGDNWLPAWANEPLNVAVQDLMSNYPALVGFTFQPQGYGTRLELSVLMTAGPDQAGREARAQVSSFVSQVARIPELPGSCGPLSVAPQPVNLA